MSKLPDIDIDTRSDFDGSDFRGVIKASRVFKGELVPHVSGYYFENIPTDELTGLSAIPFKQANEMGYFKVDLLHASVYDNFETHEEIVELLKHEPDWSLLESVENISKLSQIHDHSDIVLTIKPKSINDLADILALIRPAKRHLLVPYKMGRISRDELYSTPKSGAYHFKKAHSVAYAHVIVLEMNLLTS